MLLDVRGMQNHLGTECQVEYSWMTNEFWTNLLALPVLLSMQKSAGPGDVVKYKCLLI